MQANHREHQAHGRGNSIYRGVLTGYNDAFIVPSEVRDRLITEDPASQDILKPILRGRDIRPYRAQWAGLWLISTFPSAGININTYPAIRNHLLRFGKRRLEQAGTTYSNGVKSRKKTSHDWFELQDSCAYHEEFRREKLFWMDMSPVGRFCYSMSEFYCNNMVFMMTGAHLKYLCVVLNSSLVSWYFPKIARTSGLGLPRWEAFSVTSIPVPCIDNEATQQFNVAFDAAYKNQASSGRTPRTENMVNTLYGLTVKEARFLESS